MLNAQWFARSSKKVRFQREDFLYHLKSHLIRGTVLFFINRFFYLNWRFANMMSFIQVGYMQLSLLPDRFEKSNIFLYDLRHWMTVTRHWNNPVTHELRSALATVENPDTSPSSPPPHLPNCPFIVLDNMLILALDRSGPTSHIIKFIVCLKVLNASFILSPLFEDTEILHSKSLISANTPELPGFSSDHVDLRYPRLQGETYLTCPIRPSPYKGAVCRPLSVQL